MTHAELVRVAAKWLRGSQKCVITITESSRVGWEIPDALGWTYGGTSILVECKTSRADFLADRAKPFRAHPETGMGIRRYFMTPPGLLTAEDLPERWGLLEPDGGRGVRVRVKGVPFESYSQHHEIMLLVGAVWRTREALRLLKIFATEDPPPDGIAIESRREMVGPI